MEKLVGLKILGNLIFMVFPNILIFRQILRSYKNWESLTGLKKTGTIVLWVLALFGTYFNVSFYMDDVPRWNVAGNH